MKATIRTVASVLVLAGALLAATTARIGVKGMSCVMCARGLQASLRRVPGVEKVHVSFQRQLVLVTFNPKRVTLARIRQLIAKQGFKPVRAAAGH